MYSVKTFNECLELMSGNDDLPKKIWIKEIFVYPMRIDYKIKSNVDCRFFRKDPIRAQFFAQVNFRLDLLPGKRYRRKNFWLNNSGFSKAAHFLMKTGCHETGIPIIGGFNFHHLCYSEGQIKSSKYWAYA